MTIIEHRLSTTVVEDIWLIPDGEQRHALQDFERGPIAINDQSQGMAYQNWALSYVGNQLIVTPEVTGTPSVIRTVASVKQCSFTFDQNARVTLAYTLVDDTAYLYWYDSQAAAFVTTLLETGTVTPTLTMDDKRITQTQTNDIILWYTKQQPDSTWRLYTREQRDRFGVVDGTFYLMGESAPYIKRVGMHQGQRLQVGTSYVW